MPKVGKKMFRGKRAVSKAKSYAKKTGKKVVRTRKKY